MKRSLTALFALVLIVSVAGFVAVEQEKEDCASSCGSKTDTVADDKKAGCDGSKTERVAELITVSGEPVHCSETLGKVAEKNGMCSKGTPASGKAVLVQTAEGKMILVTAEEKLSLGETIVKLRATGAINGTHMKADKLEGFCEKSQKWHVLHSSEAAEL